MGITLETPDDYQGPSILLNPNTINNGQGPNGIYAGNYEIEFFVHYYSEGPLPKVSSSMGANPGNTITRPQILVRAIGFYGPNDDSNPITEIDETTSCWDGEVDIGLLTGWDPGPPAVFKSDATITIPSSPLDFVESPSCGSRVQFKRLADTIALGPQDDGYALSFQLSANYVQWPDTTADDTCDSRRVGLRANQVCRIPPVRYSLPGKRHIGNIMPFQQRQHGKLGK